MKILIIEDNDILRENIQKYFQLKGHIADMCQSYEKSMYMLSCENYDALVLDLGLGSPAGDGITICTALREKGNNIPILMLTARVLTAQKIFGLESGADDYITKPFDYEELLARVKSIARRNDTLKGNILNLGNISIIENTMEVRKDNTLIALSRLEFQLLCYFGKNKGKILSKEEILEKVWGEIDMFKETRTLDIHVGYLRKKLGKDLIRTIRGIGYILE